MPPRLLVGTAGWNVRPERADRFPAQGTHLERYAAVLPAVEIDSSFYRPHRPATYARWAASVPAAFRFAVKVPREITHLRRLAEIEAPLDRFLAETASLGEKRGPLLVQLPPSLRFDRRAVAAFFSAFRVRYTGEAVCEPRHASWFGPPADALLADHQVARVAADPPPAAGAETPGGWDGLVYHRLHGSPRMYYSDYDAPFLAALVARIKLSINAGVPIWCIFDNTAEGAALGNALSVLDQLAPSR